MNKKVEKLIIGTKNQLSVERGRVNVYEG